MSIQIVSNFSQSSVNQAKAHSSISKSVHYAMLSKKNDRSLSVSKHTYSLSTLYSTKNNSLQAPTYGYLNANANYTVVKSMFSAD